MYFFGLLGFLYVFNRNHIPRISLYFLFDWFVLGEQMVHSLVHIETIILIILFK